ncbi:MAG: hypothetical protein MUP09_08535 [Thiovulaceae bacterium]|nr:hypothetical protein [Sulfurimonadaceae bacterium]
MYKVTIEKECGCFRRADIAPEYSYEDKDSALIEAGALARKMNDEFCGKHQFGVRQEGEDFLVTMQMRG